MKRILLLTFGLIYISSFTFCQSSRLPLEKLDSFVSKAMNDWHLMGLALAVVKNDSVIFTKGYGYRDYAKKLPVTQNTVFPIASCSKTFTAALMGLAEKDGKIKLAEPVHPYFPEFQFYIDELTNTVTAEDMLSHRTGSAGHDWAWSFNTNFPEDVYLKSIKYQETFAPLRTQFQYSNFMFFALSVLSGKLYNTTWNDLVSKKLFHPLDMHHTYSSYISRNHFYPDTAMSYEFNDSFLLKKTNQMDDLLGAGSVNSTAADLSHWLQMWINGGKYKNQQLLTTDFVKRSVESHFIMDGGINEPYPDEHFSNIGYSWFLSSYRGHYKAHHTGNIDGFSSSITFFPFDSLGIVVLANQNNSMLIRLIPDFVAVWYFSFRCGIKIQ
jgi:CubicO group peptidase (beta-lactamase class C family)